MSTAIRWTYDAEADLETFTCPCCGGEGVEDGHDDWGHRHAQDCFLCEGTGTVERDAYDWFQRVRANR